jgi:phosphatidylethanolamine-binding protein (PEBP) family uncharacterized protein
MKPQGRWLDLACEGWTDGGAFPARYEATSPGCRWGDPGARTKSYALLLEDVDASASQPRVLWLVYDLAEGARELPSGLETTTTAPHGGHQGRNDFGRVGYAGVQSGSNPRRVALRLLALDKRLNLPPGAFPIDFLRSAFGHVVESSELLGTLEPLRSPQAAA